MNPSSTKDKTKTKQAKTKHHNLKYSSNLISLLILLVSLAIIIATTISAAQSIVNDHAQAVTRRMQLNENVAKSIEQQIKNVLQKAERTASFTGYVYIHDRQLDIDRWLKHDLLIDEEYLFINIINNHGILAASSGISLDNDYSESPIYNQLKHDPHAGLKIGIPVYTEKIKDWALPLYSRIENEQGEFVGVVIIAISPKVLGNFFKDMNISTAFLELSGLDGIVRTRVMGKDLLMDKNKTNYSWSTQYLYKPSGTYVDNGKDIDGLSRIMAFRGIADYDLVLATGTSYKEAVAMADARKESQTYITIFVNVLVILFAAMFIYLLRRQQKSVVATQANEALFRATFNHAAMGIARISNDGKILEYNNKFQRLLGYGKDELQGKDIIDLLDEDYKSDAEQYMQDRMTEYFLGMPPEIERVYLHKNGRKIWVHEALSVVRKASGMPDFMVSAIQDITERKNLEEQLSYAASHDLLTDLPNRLLLQRKLAKALDNAGKDNSILGILFLDLNGFKNINDTYGHAMGDKLLKQVAQRLQGSVRTGSGDIVARYGGDEFSILLLNLKDINHCELVAKKIAHIIAKPFDLGSVAGVTVTTSIGAAFYPCSGDTIDELMSHADFAMYYAKNSGLAYATWAEAKENMAQVRRTADW